MKRLLLASAVLGFAGVVSTANANPINTLSNMIIWSANTPGVETDPSQLALPFNPIKTAANLIANGAAAGAINFNLQGPSPGATSMVGNFLNSDTPPMTTDPCTGACLTTTLSVLGFTHATLFELTFTAPSGGGITADDLATTHDDGAALFLAGTEASCTSLTACSTDLFPISNAGPTTAEMSTADGLTPGATYDLWYVSANGDPEVLTTNNTPINGPPSVPEPASLTLLGSALLGFGVIFRRRNRV
jgi:PEP-CTERM motif